MKKLIIFLGYITLCVIGTEFDTNEKLKIEITKQVECTTKTKNGDTLRMHYKGTLEDGTVFDSSYQRGSFEFIIGVNNVIKGWDQGLLDMCEGEHRRLTIPPALAYGDKGFDGFVPPGSTITFDTELLKIVEFKDEL